MAAMMIWRLIYTLKSVNCSAAPQRPMFTSLRDGFQRESHDYPHEYTDYSKVNFLEIESYLKNIKVPEIINHWEYYRELKSRPRPIINTSCYPGVFSGEVSMFFENHRYKGY